jgi:hypothetical protein
MEPLWSFTKLHSDQKLSITFTRLNVLGGIEEALRYNQSANRCLTSLDTLKLDTSLNLPSSTIFCREQPHDGICKAFDHARGSKPADCETLEFRATLHAFDDKCLRSIFDDRFPRRHTFWSSSSWLPIEETGNMG